jgi:dTDP-4-amino-4,6-dideoxygalactose transaminase
LIKVDETQANLTRDELWKALVRKGIMADPLFDTPMYLEPSYRNKVGHGHGTHCPFNCPLYQGNMNYEEGLCPIAENVLKKVLTISPHPGLNKKDLDKIISTIRSLIN